MKMFLSLMLVAQTVSEPCIGVYDPVLNFCFTEGVQHNCNYRASSCLEAYESASCLYFRDLVDAGTCPPVSCYVMKHLTNARLTGNWCFAHKTDQACKNAYVTWKDKEIMYGTCEWNGSSCDVGPARQFDCLMSCDDSNLASLTPPQWCDTDPVRRQQEDICRNATVSFTSNGIRYEGECSWTTETCEIGRVWMCDHDGPSWMLN